MLALALGAGAPFAFMVGCRALIGIVQILPITVGGLGTRDAILLLTLPLAGITRETALALGFTSFLWNLAFHFSGSFFWLRRPVPLRGLRAMKEDVFLSRPGG
jgi:uncharacterized membrane protein YbhN (UPF0104 family)